MWCRALATAGPPEDRKKQREAPIVDQLDDLIGAMKGMRIEGASAREEWKRRVVAGSIAFMEVEKKIAEEAAAVTAPPGSWLAQEMESRVRRVAGYLRIVSGVVDRLDELYADGELLWILKKDGREHTCVYRRDGAVRVVRLADADDAISKANADFFRREVVTDWRDQAEDELVEEFLSMEGGA